MVDEERLEALATGSFDRARASSAALSAITLLSLFAPPAAEVGLSATWKCTPGLVPAMDSFNPAGPLLETFPGKAMVSAVFCATLGVGRTMVGPALRTLRARGKTSSGNTVI